MKNKPVVRIHQLCFGFPGQPLLFEQLDLCIPAGTVFGILGPNGAGKSTLIKIALGLIPLAAGTIEVFGQDQQQHRAAILRRVGLLIDGPRLYPHLSGRDNLRVWATCRGIAPDSLADRLAEVGLAAQADKLVRHYSTGMKQRLAIAIALLPDPALLILDEPTNGLDPQGIADIRQLILRLKKEAGRTIIFCSHILSEVQQVCDEVGILHQGRIVYQGMVHKGTPPSRHYAVETDQPARASQLLREKESWPVDLREAVLLVTLPGPEAVSTLIDHLRAGGIAIFQLRRLEEELEGVYLRVVK